MNESVVDPTEVGAVVMTSPQWHGTGRASVLHRKIAEVMTEARRIEKRGWNAHFAYKYVMAADVYEEIGRLLGERGVSIITRIANVKLGEDTGRETRSGQPKYGPTELNVTITLTDSETGESLSVPWYSIALDTDDKGPAKAMTAAMKYFLITTFLIGGDLPDSDEAAGAPDEESSSRATSGRRSTSSSRSTGGRSSRSRAAGPAPAPAGESASSSPPADPKPQAARAPKEVPAELKAPLEELWSIAHALGALTGKGDLQAARTVIMPLMKAEPSWHWPPERNTDPAIITAMTQHLVAAAQLVEAAGVPAPPAEAEGDTAK